ncbi:MAG: Ig-like domain-containing protein [Novosphingobium sp.]|nr:hypothetical protein [Novosphingobium sp.]
MALIIRIVSADGKTIVSKTLPALPNHIKVPPGAKVEVIDKETGHKSSLPQYINAHAGETGEDGEGNDGSANVTLETVSNWPEAIAWLDSLAAASEGTDMGDLPTSTWYAPEANQDHGKVMGYDQNTLLIGGVIGAGVIGGAIALGGGGGTSDTIAPVAPTGLDLATADDLGSASDDNVTNKTSELTISGSAEAGSRVELFDGDTSLGTTQATEAGTFSMDISLAAGIHAITATARDSAGNTSTASSALNIAVDETAPAAPTTLNLATADDSGSSNSDNLTNQTSNITITGQAEAGSTVELFRGDTSLGTGTTAANGAFSIDITLTPGANELTAVATDLSGNEGPASTPFTVTVDNTAPAPVSMLDLAADDDTGASNTDNITTKTSNLTISGTAEAGALVQLFDGSSTLLSVNADANGNFAVDIGLTVGDHAITAQVTDAAGNISSISSALEIQILAEEPLSSLIDLSSATQTFG